MRAREEGGDDARDDVKHDLCGDGRANKSLGGGCRSLEAERTAHLLVDSVPLPENDPTTDQPRKESVGLPLLASRQPPLHQQRGLVDRDELAEVEGVLSGGVVDEADALRPAAQERERGFSGERKGGGRERGDGRSALVEEEGHDQGVREADFGAICSTSLSAAR